MEALILYFFIHPQPNNIGPARQQPRDWGSLFHFSESGRGRGAQLLLISFASTRLHGICNGSINGMEDKCLHPPKISEFFVWDWEGAQKCYILPNQTTGDLKSYHLQAWITLTALSVPPRPPFLSQLCITVYTRNTL